MLLEGTSPFEVDDLHPGAYRCAKNRCWAVEEPTAQPEDTVDLLYDIAKIADEIQFGFDLLMRTTGLALPPRSAHVPESDYDLYPTVYRAVKNTPPPASEQPLPEDPDIQELVHGVLSAVNSTLKQVLNRMSPKTTTALGNVGQTEEHAVTTKPGPSSADLDLYPGAARARANRAYDELRADALPAHAHEHSLGEEFVHGVQHAVQDLRRKWVHAHMESVAKDQPDLYPDLYRYAVNQSENRAETDAKLARGPAEKTALADFFDTLSALVASAA